MKRLLPLLMLTGLLFGQDKTTIAVLEFDTQGIDNVSSSALASIVRKEVIKISDYKLVDRNAMNEILTEQGLSQSGCISSECAVEVGKLLGVQQMVNGTLSALGSLYLLDINIIDVSTGEIKITESVEHIGKIEELISPLRKTIESMLVGSTLNTGEALVYIESIPAGAMVYMNGISVGSSPIKHKIDIKSYNITLKADGYADWVQEIQGKVGETIIVKAELLESRPSSLGGLGSNEIGKWEVLRMSRSDYIDFLRLGIDERDWIENIQPAGVTVSDFKIFLKYNIPRKLWLFVLRNDFSPQFSQDMIDNNIPKELWSFILRNDFSPQFSQILINNNIPSSLWIECKILKDSIYLNEKFILEYGAFLNRLKWLINEGLIEYDSYKILKDEFGSDFQHLLKNNSIGISESILMKISTISNDKKLNTKNIYSSFLTWKQQTLNKLLRSDLFASYGDYESLRNTLIELSIWEWIVLTHFNVPMDNYISLSSEKSHPKE